MSTNFSGTRTLIPFGPRIRRCRKSESWSMAELGWQTHLTVERAALEGDPDERLLRRYKTRRRSDKLSGLSLKTLTRIERSQPVYPFSLKIVAMTLAVPMAELIHPDDPSGSMGAAAVTPAPIQEIADDIVRKADIGDRCSIRELARLLRELLDRLAPSLREDDDEPDS